MMMTDQPQNDSTNTNNQFWFWLGLLWGERRRESEGEAEKRKYRLEIFKVLAPVLIGAGIALGGHLMAKGIADANRTVSQATLLNTFMESFKTPDSLEQKLAFEALDITLKEPDSLRIKQKIAEHNEGILKGINKDNVYSLIRDIYSSKSKDIRTATNQTIINNYNNTLEVVKLLVDFATENKNNPLYNTGAGKVNTAYILSEFPKQTLQQHKSDVTNFINNIANKSDSQTMDYINIINQKIN